METENSQKLFLVSITHNSKIRELSDGNRVIVCQTNFLLWVPPFLSYELWKQRIELSKNSIQTGSQSLHGSKFSSVLGYFFLFQNSEELFYRFSNFILWPKKGKTEL